MAAEIRVEPDMELQTGAGRIDRLIAALAARQHGVVARWQLLALGMGPGAIAHRLECGRLHVVHRGVYAVGHRVISREGRWTAAVLASGSGAVLSHRSAAALWGLRSDDARPRIEVTAPRRRDARAGIQLHVAKLAVDERSVVNGIPLTSPTRTLLDLAAVLRPHALRRAVDEAEVLRLGSSLSLTDLIDRHPRRRGVAALREIVEEGRIGATITRSTLEDRFLHFLDAAGLPRPDVNTSIEGMEVDFAWRSARLIVELDGFASHGTRAAFERDRARDRRLQAAGWRVVRVTWRQLHEDPPGLAREIGRLLLPPSPP